MSDEKQTETKTDAVLVIDKRAAMAPPDPAPGGSSAADLIRHAIDRNASVDQLERLMGLQERWEANEARKAFVVAMAACKAELPPTISKDHLVDFPAKQEDGGKGRVTYRHTTLANLVGEVLPIMARHGLSHGYETEQDEKSSGRISVTCRIQHVMGHSETVRLSAYPDESGRKNKIQAIGSTVTYLQRYTLMAALGLASGDEDDDAGAGVKTKAAASTASDRALPARAAKALESFGRYGINQAMLETKLECPATEWNAEQFEALSAIWDGVAKLPQAERAAEMRAAFGKGGER